MNIEAGAKILAALFGSSYENLHDGYLSKYYQKIHYSMNGGYNLNAQKEDVKQMVADIMCAVLEIEKLHD